ncbi:MAG TPA: hypothetical protein DEP51_03110 [Clostridiales bacterium]|nr:hypothetical protein [Clostridiales bacterium]
MVIRMKNKGILLKRIILVLVIFYAMITFINQQKVLNNYNAQVNSLKIDIAEAQKKQEELNNQKDNVNSLEYIEALAREKLGMYMPNEKVYVDNEN